MTALVDAVETIRLWPDGPPTPIECPHEEQSFIAPAGIAEGSTILRNISDPSLSVVTPTAPSNGIGVIVVPGGGWTVNMWSHEGTDIAHWLTGLGYTCFILKYRVQQSPPDPEQWAQLAAATETVHSQGLPVSMLPKAIADVLNTPEYNAARDAAAEDGRRAIAIARELAPKYGLRDGALGMIGFSAGAFLAVDVALDPQAEQLAFIAPIYGGETRGATVPEDAPPLFQAVARDDVLYKICDNVVRDWAEANRPTEMHAFQRGQHGFGLIKQGMPSDSWTQQFLSWLEDLAL